MNKNEELKFTRFFINWLNKKYEYDYEAVANDDESKVDTEVDIYAKSKSGKFQQLNIQTVTSEGKLMQEFTNLRNISKRTGRNVVMGSGMDLDSEEWIKKAIDKKEKSYSKEVKQSLILLIQKDVGLIFNEEYFKNHFSEFKNSDFRGIYLIHFPPSKGSLSCSRGGQILTIKDFKIKKIKYKLT